MVLINARICCSIGRKKCSRFVFEKDVAEGIGAHFSWADI